MEVHPMEEVTEAQDHQAAEGMDHQVMEAHPMEEAMEVHHHQEAEDTDHQVMVRPHHHMPLPWCQGSDVTFVSNQTGRITLTSPMEHSFAHGLTN